MAIAPPSIQPMSQNVKTALSDEEGELPIDVSNTKFREPNLELHYKISSETQQKNEKKRVPYCTRCAHDAFFKKAEGLKQQAAGISENAPQHIKDKALKEFREWQPSEKFYEGFVGSKCFTCTDIGDWKPERMVVNGRTVMSHDSLKYVYVCNSGHRVKMKVPKPEGKR